MGWEHISSLLRTRPLKLLLYSWQMGEKAELDLWLQICLFDDYSQDKCTKQSRYFEVQSGAFGEQWAEKCPICNILWDYPTKKMLLNSTSESSYLSSAVICRGLTVCTTTGTLVADMMWESTYSIPTVVLWIGGRCIGGDTAASGASWEDQYILISLYETSQQPSFSQRPTVTYLRFPWGKKEEDNLRVPWWLGHPPFRHCDTPTRTIRHCKDSPHKHLHIETIRPHRGRTVRPPQNRSVRPLRSGSKRWLWQSDPCTIRPILCSARRGGGQF